jgi:hypothetical protein
MKWAWVSAIVALLAALLAVRQHQITPLHVSQVTAWLQQPVIANVIDSVLRFVEPRPRQENGCQCGVSTQ